MDLLVEANHFDLLGLRALEAYTETDSGDARHLLALPIAAGVVCSIVCVEDGLVPDMLQRDPELDTNLAQKLVQVVLIGVRLLSELEDLR